MSGFLPTVKKEYDFDGDKVSVEFRRLNRKQMMQIIPHLPNEKEVDDIKANRLSFKSDEDEEKFNSKNQKLLDVSIGMLETCVTEFSGLKDSDGEEIEFKVAYEEAYFFKLMTNIATDLIAESLIDPKKKRKSKGASTG